MTHRMDIHQIMKEGLPFMDMRISTTTRTGAAALALAGIVLLPEAAALPPRLKNLSCQRHTSKSCG